MYELRSQHQQTFIVLVYWNCFLPCYLSHFQILNPCSIECATFLTTASSTLPTLGCSDPACSDCPPLTWMNHLREAIFFTSLTGDVFKNPSPILLFRFLFIFADNLKYYYGFNYYFQVNSKRVYMSNSDISNSWRVPIHIPVACWVFPPGCHSDILNSTCTNAKASCFIFLCFYPQHSSCWKPHTFQDMLPILLIA